MEQPTRVVKQAKPAAESSLMDDLLNMDLTTTTQTSQATTSDDPFASDLMGMMDVIDTMGSSQQPATSSDPMDFSSMFTSTPQPEPEPAQPEPVQPEPEPEPEPVQSQGKLNE